MSCKDAYGRVCTHKVQVHFRFLEYQGENTMWRLWVNACAVYGQYGICIEMASRSQLDVTEDEYKEMAHFNTECTKDGPDSADEQFLKKKIGPVNGVTAVLLPTRTLWKTTWDKNTNFWGADTGCTNNKAGRQPALIMIRNAAPPWTLAHELAHLLLWPKIYHIFDDPAHVLYLPAESIKADPPGFNTSMREWEDCSERDRLFKSPFCIKC